MKVLSGGFLIWGKKKKDAVAEGHWGVFRISSRGYVIKVMVAQWKGRKKHNVKLQWTRTKGEQREKD